MVTIHDTRSARRNATRFVFSSCVIFSFPMCILNLSWFMSLGVKIIDSRSSVNLHYFSTTHSLGSPTVSTPDRLSRCGTTSGCWRSHLQGGRLGHRDVVDRVLPRVGDGL